jgi:very-short-patch-repair endonuclease
LPDLKIAIEVEGRGHGMENRYQGDLYKYNRLAAEGWLLLRCDRKILFDNPDPFFAMVRDVYIMRNGRR